MAGKEVATQGMANTDKGQVRHRKLRADAKARTGQEEKEGGVTEKRESPIFSAAIGLLDKFILASVLLIITGVVAEVYLPTFPPVILLLDPAKPRSGCSGFAPPGRLGTLCGFHHPSQLGVLNSDGRSTLLIAQSRRIPFLKSSISNRPALLTLQGETARELWVPTQTESERKHDRLPYADLVCEYPTSFSPESIATAPIVRSETGSTANIAILNLPRSTIEFVTAKLNGSSSFWAAQWAGCIRLPQERHYPLALMWTSSGHLLVSVTEAKSGPMSELMYQIRMWLGWTNSRILRWDLQHDSWQEVFHHEGPLTSMAEDQGLFIFSAGKQVCKAFLTSTALVEEACHTLTGPVQSVALVGRTRAIAIASKDDAWSLFTAFRCALGRSPCDVFWSLTSFDVEIMQPVKTFPMDARMIGHVSSVAYAWPNVYIGSFYGDRIGVIRSSVGLGLPDDPR